MKFGDYSGEYKSKVFKVLMSFFDIDIEELSKLTGFTESHLDGILRQENLEKRIGKQILSVMNLNNNDYDWIHVVISEIAFDRMLRQRKLDEIRFNQRKLKIEQERVNKDNGKESSKVKIKSRRNKTNKEDNETKASGKGDKISKENNVKKGDSEKGVTKKGDQSSKERSKGSKTSEESGDKTRKVIKKRSKK